MLSTKRNPGQPGKVVTFYSYKGGVGRSFILANVASQLALWGYKVLCVDWDLEAPGLTDYFLEEVDDEAIFKKTNGIVDLMLECQREGSIASDWRRSAIEIPLFHRTLKGLSGSLDLICAGKDAPSAQYIENVHQLNWDVLYGKQDFANILDGLKREWQKEYDVVFVDSRTGISDVSGICTVQLPDILALVLTPNKQSLEGIFEVANRVVESHSIFPLSDGKLITVPILSRLDQRDEHTIAESWLARINKTLTPLYSSWLHKGVSVQRIQDFSKVPYVTRWSFGESLAVLLERGSDTEQISYSFQSLAALIIEGIDSSKEFTRSRDEFVQRLAKDHTSKQGAEVIDPLARKLLESKSALAISAYAKELQYSEKNLDDAYVLWARAAQLDPHNKSMQKEYVDFLKIRRKKLLENHRDTNHPNELSNLENLIAETELILDSMSSPKTSIRVFISYSYDSIEYRRFVLNLSDRLREDGLDCVIDQYLNGAPPEGWLRWLESQIEAADFVLVMCTDIYSMRFRGKETRGGLGVNFEGAVVSQRLYDEHYFNTKFIPVIPDDGSIDNVPVVLKAYSTYRLDSQYETLYRVLTGQPEYNAPGIGSVRSL